MCQFLPPACNGWTELESVIGPGATDEAWWPHTLTTDECLAMRFVWEVRLVGSSSLPCRAHHRNSLLTTGRYRVPA